MRVIQIQNEADLRALKPAWDGLLRESAADTIFLTWEWVTAWWAAYGKPGELWILAAFDEQDVLRGIAPLRRETARRYGQTVSTLTFVGDGSNDSDYLDTIAARGYEEQVMASFREHWENELHHGAVVLLNEIPETSPCLAQLRGFSESQGKLWTETEVPCGTVHLPDNWNGYLAKLRPRFRTKIRSVLRDLEGHPEVQFGFCENGEEVRRMLPILFDLHTKRWAEVGKPGVFGWDKKREFYFALSELLLERGWLRFSWLKWNDTVLACQYGFAYQGKYFLLQEGYEPASEHWNLGIALRAWSIRKFVEEGLREYDFLGGRVLRHRSDWGAEVKNSKKIQLAESTYKNLVFCRGSEWEERARESVKRLVPEKILAARQQRLEQHANGNVVEATSSGGDWMRGAMAECYFRFHVTGLARRVRDQYHLSVNPGRRWPKLSRREGTTGRILYYHRVNDDNDPFFPAISTRLFDRLMRFVSRHYQVVSLAEMLKRLESGAPEQLMAITFDDGYQDNYQHAFPILQRYGLPASIFLNTGPIDSREPLWFEQLALALKKTDREFIELEIDIPRRFWMRTQAERLDANSQIFSLLRGLSDTDRRRWLNEVLGKLGVHDDERRGKMLTWDEIRLMKSRGIDFGGHTVTHPFVSKLTPQQVTWEAAECKRRIEAELQSTVEHFAYPNGREEDFEESNKALIRAAGYRAALTTIWGSNHRATDPMALKRGGPWEETAALFAYKLDWYQLVDA
jgi:peptidoglycan/xylan/chitin deacetylase (PgdA/CDA1 family)/CelD/BcsL family acetyltransferase involved in cellulose biosynthesis